MKSNQKLTCFSVATLVLALSYMPQVNAQTWCVVRGDAADNAVQSLIDFVCFVGVINCSPIQAGGACVTGTVKDRANYVVNAYYQSTGQNSGSCGFAGLTVITSTPPSPPICQVAALVDVKNREVAGISPSIDGRSIELTGRLLPP